MAKKKNRYCLYFFIYSLKVNFNLHIQHLFPKSDQNNGQRDESGLVFFPQDP